MKIRPLHKFEEGYISDDGNYFFLIFERNWLAYKRKPNYYYFDGPNFTGQPIFYESYPTLKSLIKAIESI